MRFGIVGDPVDHSRSPAIQNAGFRALGIDATYEYLPTTVEEFPRVMQELRSGDLSGVNVTMPHKGRAFDAVDTYSDLAQRTRAVNTIVMRGDALYGTNTDVAGAKHMLNIVDPEGDTPVHLLGAGGAAAAALVAAHGRRLFVSARSEREARDLLESTGCEGELIEWGGGTVGAIVMNATPLGMHGETVPHDVLAACSAFADMTYGPKESPSLVATRAKGLPCADGIDMLLGQAFDVFTTFTGMPAPVHEMQMAARMAPYSLDASNTDLPDRSS